MDKKTTDTRNVHPLYNPDYINTSANNIRNAIKNKHIPNETEVSIV
jgi:hypothetical protein